RGDVEPAVGPEVDRAAVMIVGGEVRILPDEHLARGARGVPHHREAADPVPWLERRVVRVEIPVRRERGVEGETHEAPLAARGLDTGNGDQRAEGGERAALVDQDT